MINRTERSVGDRALSERAHLASAGRKDTYIETLESVVGTRLISSEASRIVLSVDDCIRIRQRLSYFYSVFPLSVDDISSMQYTENQITPIFTSDLANLQNSRQIILAGIANQINLGTNPSTGRLANLFLYAQSTVMSDELMMICSQIGMDTPGRQTDVELAEEATKAIRSICYLRELITSNVLVFYFPDGDWNDIYDALSDDVEMGIGLTPLDEFREWISSEVVTDLDLQSHKDTFAMMAVSEMAVSLSFCSMIGLNSCPVLSSKKAIRSYVSLGRATGYSKIDQDKALDIAHLYSHSYLDFSKLPPSAFADIRFDSKPFLKWQEFLAETLEEARSYSNSEKEFDAIIKREIRKRGIEFKTLLKDEFSGGAISDAFRFDSTNAIGLMSSVGLSVYTQTHPYTAVLCGLGALSMEKVWNVFKWKKYESVRLVLRAHYHAFAASPVT